MAQPEYFGSGTTPQRSDTRRMLYAKWLNALGGIALKSDTIWLLLQKIVKKLRGDCVAPLAPVLQMFLYTVGGTATLKWTEAVNPSLDFIVYSGTTSGGPYPTSNSFGASLRQGDITVSQVVTSYAIIVARNSAGCVSSNSNEVLISPS